MAWAHAALGHLEPRDFSILFLVPTSLCCSGPSLSSHFNVPSVLNKHGRASQQEKALPCDICVAVVLVLFKYSIP